MKKILVLLLFAGMSILYAQDDMDASIPDIPEIPDVGNEPPTPVMNLPQNKTPIRQQPSSMNNRSSSLNQGAQEGPMQDVTVKPETSKEIGGAPVFNPAQMFMDHFKFEALFSSRAWWNFWWAPDMGLMRVTSLPQPIQTPRGVIVKWQRDSLGNPMTYLKAQLQFPRLQKPDAESKEEPLKSVPIIISQAVVFYQRPGGWIASASPVYVTMQDGDKKFVLAPVQRGQAVWRAWVGHGGIYVENFIGAGLAAARTELNQYFRDEEIRLFIQGNSDVIFYLRPQDALAVKTASN